MSKKKKKCLSILIRRRQRNDHRRCCWRWLHRFRQLRVLQSVDCLLKLRRGGKGKSKESFKSVHVTQSICETIAKRTSKSNGNDVPSSSSSFFICYGLYCSSIEECTEWKGHRATLTVVLATVAPVSLMTPSIIHEHCTALLVHYCCDGSGRRRVQ